MAGSTQFPGFPESQTKPAPSLTTPGVARLLTATFSLILMPFVWIGVSFFVTPLGERLLLTLVLPLPITLAVACLINAGYRMATSSVSADAFFTHRSSEKRVTLSEVESLIVAGNAAAATEKFDALLAEFGLDERLCRTAVNFYLGKLGDSERGENLLRRMRAEQPATFELYATQRLIDLYMRSEETQGKAQTELRRLAGRFPGSQEAAGAVAALERLRTG